MPKEQVSDCYEGTPKLYGGPQGKLKGEFKVEFVARDQIRLNRPFAYRDAFRLVLHSGQPARWQGRSPMDSRFSEEEFIEEAERLITLDPKGR
jgi:hypothetical protein